MPCKSCFIFPATGDGTAICCFSQMYRVCFVEYAKIYKNAILPNKMRITIKPKSEKSYIIQSKVPERGKAVNPVRQKQNIDFKEALLLCRIFPTCAGD